MGGSRGLVSHARRTKGDTALGKMTAYIIHFLSIPLWCNGSTTGSDPVDVGSNPAGGATELFFFLDNTWPGLAAQENIAALLSKLFT